MDTEEVIEQIHLGQVGVIPTDTLYGLVGTAMVPETVTRIYELKKRDPEKPLIVLISGIEDLEQFGVVVSDALYQQLEHHWPGPVSIILPTIDETFSYLERGSGGIAFRVPNDGELLSLLKETGPLVAPSANPEGLPPATTIEEAKDYFGSDVMFYLDGGKKDGEPSTIISIDEDANEVTIR
jgi:L-threonylcarbamoyladenylate synthase